MDETFEEVIGSRTTQPTQVQPGKADEIAYRDLKPGEVIQAGDEWQGDLGNWIAFHESMNGQTAWRNRARRPHNITELLKQRDQAAHEYRLYREALTAEQAAHKVTMANGLQACKERDDAEQALKMARAALEKTSAARAVIIEERNEAERLLAETRMERDKAWNDQKAIQSYRDTALQQRIKVDQALLKEREAHQQTSNDRDRLISELNECQQQRQRLQTALEELQRRHDAAAGVDTLTAGEVVENVLSALEIAGHALEYLADVGVNEEAGHYSGFSAAVAVVRKIREAAK